ncbi:cytochrome c oxidase subunit VIIc [Pediculus humanus corporis]|uniref:Cytochrome c oxidase subunit VIIc n=1 Tax=Pediculus humanus subsp. corporis TaxID=121224 RepID=E0VWA0_PEDHC|nr:cytochrome c oxidase subunit VIIc [Pediculus humanus corporis]EEB17656.1 cytochrome c oxidase subunit VIIc [Pediculus humanus corporis]
MSDMFPCFSFFQGSKRLLKKTIYDLLILKKRNHGRDHRETVHDTLPFQIKNVPRFTLMFTLYSAIGIGVPFYQWIEGVKKMGKK